MQLSSLTSFFKHLSPTNLIKKAKTYFGSALDKVSFGRGLTIWQKPKVELVKNKNEFFEFKLPNGLKVLAKQSPGNDFLATLNFDSGAAKDPKGKEGLAHFLEHLVCSGTEDFGKRIFDIARINHGYFNAMTTHQATSYITKLPKDKMETSLKILSSLAQKVKIKKEESEKERSVIAAETVTTASPSKKLYEKIMAIFYSKDHPVNRSVIGTSQTLEKITQEDLENFYKKEYSPNNATLVISGDFDLYELKSLLEKHFGEWKPAKTSPEVDFKADQKWQGQEHYFSDSNIASTAMYQFETSKFNHRENLIASFISNALAGGKSSRLYQKLIEGNVNGNKSLASEIAANNSSSKYEGCYMVSIKPLDKDFKTNVQKIEEVIKAELEDIKNNGLKDDEIQELINLVSVSEVYKKDSQHSSVNAVLQYQINNDDWRKAIDLEQELKKITNDDIKAFAKKYFKTPTKIIIEGKSGAQDLDLSELFAQKPQVLKQSEEKILDQKELDEIKALSGGISNLRVKLNGLDKSNTPNFEIVAKEDSSLPVAYIETIMPYGTLTLSPKQKYQIGMLGQLISNCGTYNPKTQLRLRNTDIEKLTSYLGMGYSLNPLETRIDLEFNSPSEKLDQSLALLHERLHYPLIKASTNPQFKKELEQELERSKASILNTLEIIKRQGDYKAPKLLNDLIFPEGHIDRNIDPDELIKIIKETKLEDLLEIYNKIYFAGSGKIAASGNINAQTIKEKFVPIISSWNQENHKALTNDYSRMSPVKKHIKASINIVESHNNSPNTQILIANPIDITKQDSDYYAAILANAVLGGSGFSARLTKFVREGKGLVYGIGSNFDSYRDGAGKFSIESSCDPRNSKLVLANILKTIKELMDKGVTDAELELAKENLKKSNSFNSRKAAGEVINHLQYLNRDEKFFNNFNHMIDSISKEQVMAALKRLVKPENFTIVITKPKSTRVKEIEEVAKAKSPADLLALAA